MEFERGLVSLLAAGGVTATGLAGLAAFARSRYAVQRASDATFTVPTADGWDLRIFHYRPPGAVAFAEPIILCHGLAANSWFFDLDDRHSLARDLARRGFHTLVPDLRGREGSWPRARYPRHTYTFDHHAAYDAPAIVAGALARTEARRAFWVGHSMGGMVGYVHAGHAHAHLAGLVTVASPARMRTDRILAQLVRLALLLPFDPIPQRFLARAFAPLATQHFPPIPEFSALRSNMDLITIRRAMANVIVDLPRALLRQFIEWAERGHPISAHGGVDYRDAIARVRTPLLCLAASGDRLAPPRDVRPAFELVRSSDRRFIVIGAGGAGDPAPGRLFGHSDLVLGRDAPDLIYPLIAEWIEGRATRLRARRAG